MTTPTLTTEPRNREMLLQPVVALNLRTLAAAGVNGPGPERNRLGLTSDGRKAETDRNPLHGPVSWDGGE
ncbi:hypothetical protein quinque_001243 [Culex quinquefasciatus]